jgi:hypothetical protein
MRKREREREEVGKKGRAGRKEGGKEGGRKQKSVEFSNSTSGIFSVLPKRSES